MGFPQEDWHDGLRRVYINMTPDAKGKWKSFTWAEEGECAASQVTDNDKIEAVVDEDGWSKIVDKEWFARYIRSLYVQLDGAPFEPDEEVVMDELKTVIGSTKVRVVWPVAVVLATRT